MGSSVGGFNPFKNTGGIGKAPETADTQGGGTGQQYRGSSQGDDDHHDESFGGDDNESMEAILYNSPVGLDIGRVDPNESSASHGLSNFDKESLNAFFETHYDLVLRTLIVNGIVGARNRIYWFPSVRDVMKMLAEPLGVGETPIPDPIENDRSNIPAELKDLTNLAFEVVSFLIGGLPQLDNIGTVNDIEFQDQFPSYGKQILKRLIQKGVLREYKIITIPPFNVLAQILGEDESDKTPYTLKLISVLLNGIGQYPLYS